MIPFLPLLAGAVLGADFPSDTLLPLRRVETRVSTGAVEEEIRYDYARDSRDWLYETKSWTYAGVPHTRVDVTITDREGRYRGGSRKRSSDPLFTFEPVYGPEGRIDSLIIRSDTMTVIEHRRYDERGNLVEMFRVRGSDTGHSEFYPHTYDAQGRIATWKDYDEDSLNATVVFRYDAQGRLAARIEYLAPWTFLDSTAYEYRPDGRLHREVVHPEPGGSPGIVFTWEYKVWQVPLSLARRSRPPGGSLAGYPMGKAFDPLGRALAGRPAEGIPLYLRP